MDLNEIILLAIRAAFIWVLWELGRAVRMSTRARPTDNDQEIQKSLQKIRRSFEGIEARLAQGSAAGRGSKNASSPKVNGLRVSGNGKEEVIEVNGQ